MKFKQLNTNVKLSFIFEALQSFGRGIWMGNIFSLYVVIFVENSQGVFGYTPNELLGITAGASGIAMTAIVFPSGFLADKFPRQLMLKTAALVGIIAMLTLALAESIFMILVAMLLWGAFQGITRPAFEAILADSLKSGSRSGIYAKIHLTRQFFMASGPFLNVILFFILGDKWDISILKSVMLVGIIISMASTFVLFLFKDSHSMGEESESLFNNNLENSNSKQNSKLTKKIPILLVTSNVIIGMGAGMTIKFFPVFFRSIYGMKPISVQLIMGFTFIFTGIFGMLAQKFSLKKGRGEMIFVVQFLATLCLIGIGFYPAVVLLIPLFILRGSLMNAAQPLSRSILMDVVPKRHRGKWNSVETIAWGLFWNASAVIGGFLIGDNNFQRCFFITAGIYLIGTIPILMLIPLVHKEISQEK
ncbi:MAG: MFS transporter [Candidatus Cloacimonetes bacterium]|nr:MFS transporter [Candidatus Cloacimonadota bacterium]MCF7815268.1 MFS transporter [Candidatus Cloacimonadota bacterium]MCF7868103.1 MFS transporter [Candidatus Cloacimonadota bacterium]MCF7883569.1 MFS transporter [Candidatus Cloacimonadota bacterium]